MTPCIFKLKEKIKIMSAKKRGLGRGLDVLLGGAKLETSTDRLRMLSVEQLTASIFQPRKDMDPVRLQELADSISAQGVVQPVVAREVDGSSYEIIAGERRWRAAKLAGLAEMPVIVRKVSDQAALAIALIENIQREDLNAMEEAEALKRLLDEYRMTHQQLADSVGKSRVTISNLLRLNDLSSDVKTLLLSGHIEMGHARALLSLTPDQQVHAANQIVEQGLTVRATEALVQDLREGKGNKIEGVAKFKRRDPDVERLQEDLSARLGAPVTISCGEKGSGRLVIKYSSLDELENVLDRLRKGIEH